MTVEVTEIERLLISSALSEYGINCTERARELRLFGCVDSAAFYENLSRISDEVMEKFRPT